MARPGDGSGMIGFVKRDASNDDLKISIPAANSHIATPSERLNARPEGNRQVTFAFHHNVPRTMLDTDDDFDKTVTTAAGNTIIHPSADSRRLDEEPPSHEDPGKALDEDGDEVESYYSDENADDEQDAHDHPPQGVEASHVKPDGRGLGPISGDTYPDTTSGRPSTIHTDDQHEDLTVAYSQAHIVQSTAIPERGAGTRLSYPARVKQNAPADQSKDQFHGAQQRNAPPLQPEQLLKDAGSGFSYAPNEAQPARAFAPPVLQPQYHSHKPTPASAIHHKPSAAGTQNTVRETRKQGVAHHSGPESRQNGRARQLQQNIRKRQPEGAHRSTAPEPEQSGPPYLPQNPGCEAHIPPVEAVGVPESATVSEVGDHDIPRESSIKPKQGTQEAALLDHYPPELYDMPYDKIKAATFDLDPNADEPDTLVGLHPDDPVSKKMDALLSMDARVKADYLTSLGIEEWEEAGDWFLAAFGQLTGQFKTARQEKRRIAREFEDEVELRYESITKKRKLISGAIDEMKESGGRVLSGTPKKCTQVR